MRKTDDFRRTWLKCHIIESLVVSNFEKKKVFCFGCHKCHLRHHVKTFLEKINFNHRILPLQSFDTPHFCSISCINNCFLHNLKIKKIKNYCRLKAIPRVPPLDYGWQNLKKTRILKKIDILTRNFGVRLTKNQVIKIWSLNSPRLF